MTDQVKCSECGMLCLRYSQSGQYCEANQDYRNHGKAPRNSVTGSPICDRVPHCHRGALPLHKMFTSLSPEEMAAALSAPRKCEQFVKWIPGLSPKEHEEIAWAQELRQEAAQRNTEQQAWNAKIEESIERRHRETIERDLKRDKDQMEWQNEYLDSVNAAKRIAFASLIVSALVGLAVIASYISEQRDRASRQIPRSHFSVPGTKSENNPLAQPPPAKLP